MWRHLLPLQLDLDTNCRSFGEVLCELVDPSIAWELGTLMNQLSNHSSSLDSQSAVVLSSPERCSATMRSPNFVTNPKSLYSNWGTSLLLHCQSCTALTLIPGKYFRCQEAPSLLTTAPWLPWMQLILLLALVFWEGFVPYSSMWPALPLHQILEDSSTSFSTA